ncbi:putative uncharacterized protein DDB_G0274405 isoform X2 [Abrus precatorius]|uniref:WRC domain-containing protein n=1 Tax=Abrus precatorius TaxID=3816 RepID=A0A8B8MC53_ABRPR|nr:putative uncharacterized protein DDB_G0274405 isoform X2 [Abrus precatorius]
MRIRNRQVPFPLLPVIHSDPNLINRSPVMVQLNEATTSSPKPSCTHGLAIAPLPLLDRPQPSDQPLPPIGKATNGCDDSTGEGGTHRRHHRKQEPLVEDGRWEEGGGQKGNDTRKGNISCSETPAEAFSPSSPSKQDGRWCEGEKAFPLKKRRGSLENATEDNNNDDNNNNNRKKMKMKNKMKTKMNKKCLVQDDSNEAEEEEEEEEEVKEEEVMRETKPEVNVGKKRVRGSALMEGSRCSRVNGRGWRCCQQTLVGYSLCEHHLGKGRLRSMTSVRNKSIGTTSGAPKNMALVSEPSSQKQTTKCSSVNYDPMDNDGEDKDEKKPLMVTKKRMKLGMVKARSISSLLGQTNDEIVAIAEDINNQMKYLYTT